jgi:DNA-dependent RNA polymerase auxiliary subunit epsilon
MIYKVYVQENKNEVPVRERTKALYIEAGSDSEVYEKLSETPYAVEYMHVLEGAHLEYEKQNENFKVMEF